MKENKDTILNEKQELTCGIIMPISPIDGCSAEHWKEVLEILREAVAQTQFTPNLVSDSDDVGIIQKRIIQNIYNNEIVVCDVSGKNPNVMFELGLRLAFDKPTIIIKDDATSYSFDTSPIEHLEYPRDLRYNSIILFKQRIKEKIEATYKRSQTDSNYTTFLKHFGEFKISKISEIEVTTDKYLQNVIEELKDSFNSQFTRLKHEMRINQKRQITNQDFYTSISELKDEDVLRILRSNKTEKTDGGEIKEFPF